MLYFWGMRYICFTLLLGIFFSNIVIAQDKWDLRKCVEYAWQNNLNIKQQEIQASLSALNEKQSKNLVYPNANFNNNTGLQFGRSVDRITNQYSNSQALFQSYNLNADIMIFNWNRVKNTLLASKYDTKAALANVEKSRNDIALSVATSFLQALLNREQIGISQIQFEQTKSQLEATRKRVRAGALPELNAAELEAQLARDSTSIINAKATAELSLLQLKALLNLDAAAPFDIDVPPVEKIPVDPIATLQPDIVFQLAIKNQPAQKVNQLRLQSLQTNVKVAKASMYPSISAFAGLGTNFSSPFKNYSTSFAGYDTSSSYINIGANNYPVWQPGIKVTQSQKSFGQLWQGWGGQLNDNFGQNFGIAISIPIFNNGGAARTAYQRAKLNVKTAEITIMQADQQLKQDIYQAYTTASAALQRYNASITTFNFSQKTYDFAKKRYDVGLLGTFELITNQNNLNSARMNVLLAQYEYVFRMKVLEFYKGEGLKL